MSFSLIASTNSAIAENWKPIEGDDAEEVRGYISTDVWIESGGLPLNRLMLAFPNDLTKQIHDKKFTYRSLITTTAVDCVNKKAYPVSSIFLDLNGAIVLSTKIARADRKIFSEAQKEEWFRNVSETCVNPAKKNVLSAKTIAIHYSDTVTLRCSDYSNMNPNHTGYWKFKVTPSENAVTLIDPDGEITQYAEVLDSQIYWNYLGSEDVTYSLDRYTLKLSIYIDGHATAKSEDCVKIEDKKI